MVCKKCGAELRDQDRFCPQCGVSVAVEHVTAEPVEQTPADKKPSDETLNNNPILVRGILAVAFACTWPVAFLGIIFGIQTKGLLDAFLAKGGQLAGRAKVGGILGKVGFWLGIGMTILVAIYITCLVILLALGLMKNVSVSIR